MDPADINDSFKIKIKGKWRWQCNKCEKDYSSKYCLMTHLVGHTGIKPHVCTECGKAFKQLSHLNTHQLRHAGVRPHTCTECGKTFVQSSHLKRHMKTHNPEDALHCNLCPRRFTYPSELRAHQVKMHGPDRVKKQREAKPIGPIDLNDASRLLHQTGQMSMNGAYNPIPYSNGFPVEGLNMEYQDLPEQKPDIMQLDREISAQRDQINNITVKIEPNISPECQLYTNQTHSLTLGNHFENGLHSEPLNHLNVKIEPNTSPECQLYTNQTNSSTRENNFENGLHPEPLNHVNVKIEPNTGPECQLYTNQTNSSTQENHFQNGPHQSEPLNHVNVKIEPNTGPECQLYTNQTNSSTRQNNFEIGPHQSEPYRVDPQATLNDTNDTSNSDITETHHPWPCNRCSKTFATEYEIIKHMSSSAHENPIVLTNPLDLVVDDTCATMVDGVRRWQCKKCAKTYSTKYGLETHMVDHKGTKPFQCVDCGKGFKQLSHLNTHRLRHQGLRPHRCEICSKTFVQKSHLKRHLHTHSTDGAFFCDECPRKFTYPSELRAHREKAHSEHVSGYNVSERPVQYVEQIPVSRYDTETSMNGEKLIVCPECGKGFHYQSQFDKHMKRHRNIRPHICSECGMQFMEIHHLNQHLFTHTGIKPHKCPVCFRAFTLEANMKRHLVIHTGIRNHECHICRRRFTQKQTLRAHMITHTDIKPYVCRYCGKAFRRNRNLLCHLQLHTDSKPYKCLSCGLRFNRKGNLKKHQKEKHGLDSTDDFDHFKPLDDKNFLNSVLDNGDLHNAIPYGAGLVNGSHQNGEDNHYDKIDHIVDNSGSETVEFPQLEDVNEDQKPRLGDNKYTQLVVQSSRRQSDSDQDTLNNTTVTGGSYLFGNGAQWVAQQNIGDDQDILNKPRQMQSKYFTKHINPELGYTDETQGVDNIPCGTDSSVVSEPRTSRRKGQPRKLHSNDNT